jgi:hypothetical protein
MDKTFDITIDLNSIQQTIIMIENNFVENDKSRIKIPTYRFAEFVK